MIFLGSRYETATIDMVARVDGTVNVVAFRGDSPLAPGDQDFSYTVKVGDRLDMLAYQFYGREDYYWVIADANPGINLNPPTPGQVLVVPGVVG